MTTDHRAAGERLMRQTLADEAAHHDWTYHAIRPCPVPPTWHSGQRVWGDCSKGVQFLCKWAGVLDPMNMHYGDYGNSETLCVKLQHLDHASQLLVMDIVTFGVRGSEHAAIVMERGSDPLLWSFGHQGAPNAYRLSVDHRVRQFLRNPIPHYVPTPQDKVRAKTGYFAWVAWKLGEGDWLHYGVANPRVRPNVPRVIPPHWWKRYAQFVANRNRADEATTAKLALA